MQRGLLLQNPKHILNERKSTKKREDKTKTLHNNKKEPKQKQTSETNGWKHSP